MSDSYDKGIDEALRWTAQQERAAIVAFIRKSTDLTDVEEFRFLLLAFAGLIERGDHVEQPYDR